MALLVRWLVSSAAVAAAVYLLPGVRLEGGPGALVAVAFLLGLVNAILRPLLRWFACGLIVMTLGLFLLVINAALLLLTAWVSREFGIAFHIDGFGDALLGSLIISTVSFLLSIILPGRRDRR